MITISSESKPIGEGEFIQREFSMDEFKRSFQISELINQENISASYEPGILRILLPFREENEEKSRDIEVA